MCLIESNQDRDVFYTQCFDAKALLTSNQKRHRELHFVANFGTLMTCDDMRANNMVALPRLECLKCPIPVINNACLLTGVVYSSVVGSILVEINGVICFDGQSGIRHKELFVVYYIRTKSKRCFRR